MCLDDFLDISPSEFTEIHERWIEREKIREQNDWNRARWTVFKTLCPPEKKRINIYDIDQFDWDPKSEERGEVPISNKKTYEAVKKKYGQRLQARNRDSSQR